MKIISIIWQANEFRFTAQKIHVLVFIKTVSSKLQVQLLFKVQF